MYDVAGCLHFHSAHSYDARVPVADIVREALNAGLDYAVLSDHFNLDARQEGWERWHESAGRRVLLIVGEEISPRYNHYLALGIRQPVLVSKQEADPQTYIDAVREQGGFGFICHPDHAGVPLVHMRSYPWVDWDVVGYAGMSVWDLMTDWSRRLRSPWQLLLARFGWADRLRGPRPETLARWDALNAKTACPGIGEIDNHASRKRYAGFSATLFPFSFAFRTIRTHLLLPHPLSGNGEQDIATVLEALRKGQGYISLDYWHDPTGFLFRIYNRLGDAWPGGMVLLESTTLLEVKLPSQGRIRVLRDGRVVREERRPHVQMDVEFPGVYRVEADQPIGWGRWRPWIFSNPIRVVKG